MDCDGVGSRSSFQWAGQAWEAIHDELQHTIQQSFRKCGITVAIDGSEDHSINIRGLGSYQVEWPVATSEMGTLDTSGSDSGSGESTTSSRSVGFRAEVMS